MCGIDASSAQWCGCIFILCYTHLNFALLPHKTVIINFPIWGHCINQLKIVLIPTFNHYTGIKFKHDHFSFYFSGAGLMGFYRIHMLEIVSIEFLIVPIIMVVGGVFAFFTAIFGIYATAKEDSCLLITHATFMMLQFFVLIAGKAVHNYEIWNFALRGRSQFTFTKLGEW